MSEIAISFDLSRIDFRRTSDLLMASYWGGHRTDVINRRAFEHSLCVAAFVEEEQIGFARAVTDFSVMAYLSDVMVWPDHRGRGVGQLLVKALLDHPDLSTVVHFLSDDRRCTWAV